MHPIMLSDPCKNARVIMTFFTYKTNIHQAHIVTLKGIWNISTIGEIEKEIKMHRLKKQIEKEHPKIHFDFSGISDLDSYGILGFAQLMERYGVKYDDNAVSLDNVPEKYEDLIKNMFSYMYTQSNPPKRAFSFRQCIDPFYRIYIDLWLITTFCGHVLLASVLMFGKKHKIPLTAILRHIEEAGARALVIISVIGMLIGMILTQQMIYQLSRYGGQDFVVNGVAIIVLRDLGVLMVAITLAGRTVSAYTSEIGLMKTQQEIDAMRVLNLDPVILLVIPRIIALVIVMPILTVIMSVVALFATAIVCYVMLDFSFDFFYSLLKEAATIKIFLIGIIKAPFIGFWMALIGCMHGLRVQSTASSLGKNTTHAVVKSILAILIINAVFAFFFSYINY